MGILERIKSWRKKRRDRTGELGIISTALVNYLDKKVKKNDVTYQREVCEAYVRDYRALQDKFGELQDSGTHGDVGASEEKFRKALDETVEEFHTTLKKENKRVQPMSKVSNLETGVENGMRNAVATAIATISGGVITAAVAEVAIGGTAIGGLVAAATAGGIVKGAMDIYGAKRSYQNRLRGAYESLRENWIEKEQERLEELREKQKEVDSGTGVFCANVTVPEYVVGQLDIDTQRAAVVNEGNSGRVTVAPVGTSDSKSGSQRAVSYQNRNKSYRQVAKASPATETLKEILKYVAKGKSVEESWQEKVSRLKEEGRVNEYILLDKTDDNNGQKEVIWIAPENEGLIEAYKATKRDDKQAWIEENKALLVKYKYQGDSIKDVEFGDEVKNTIVPVFNSTEKIIKAIRLDGGTDVVDHSVKKRRKAPERNGRDSSWVASIQGDRSSRVQTPHH